MCVCVCTYPKGEGGAVDSGSNRKCFWVTWPVAVWMVTTGKPICSTHVFMMSDTLAGRLLLFLSTACGDADVQQVSWRTTGRFGLPVSI